MLILASQQAHKVGTISYYSPFRNEKLRHRGEVS